MVSCVRCGRANGTDALFCSACGAPLPDGDRTHERRKTVTVVFCDLVGSTTLGEQLDPEATRRLIARYFEAMKAALERHGGTVEKFIGDAVMAVFGIPTVHEDDALRAVRAAVEMREALDRLNEELARPSIGPDPALRLAIRVGVDTGEAAVGEDEARQRLATGHAVNMAARLEQAAQPGQILLGSQTARLVRGAVEVEALEPLEVKGASQPVAAWRLVSISPNPQAMGRPADTPFVGRRTELTGLERVFHATVADAVPALVTIAGPPGIGKSRLAAELGRKLGSHAVVVSGRCLPYGEGITYSALGEVLRQILDAGPTPGEGGGTHTVGTLLGDDADAAVVSTLVTRALSGAEGAVSPDETAWAFRRVFEALARQRALVVVIDDIHWAEPTLLDLLEYVLTFSTGPILLVCLTRLDLFETRPSWAIPRSRSTVVGLEPLSADETRRLVDELVDLQGVAQDLRARIVERAGGYPLFVEQLLAMVADRNAADVTASAAELPIPPTIQALLAARIDALPADERSILQAAAIEGLIFRRSSVAELLGETGRGSLAARLMNLARKGFISPDRALFHGEDSFRFNHELIRDAAYEMVPKSERASLHQRFAAWQEGRAGSDEAAEVIAHHLDQAYRYRADLAPGDEGTLWLGSLAGRWLVRAGLRAGARGDRNAAVRLLRRAGELLRSDPGARVALLPDLGRALREDGELAEASAVLDEAIAESRRLGDQQSELRASEESVRVRTQREAMVAMEGERVRDSMGAKRFDKLFRGSSSKAVKRLHRQGKPRDTQS